MNRKLAQAILERSGGLCERVVDGRRCMSPGDWRGQHQHHRQFRSRGGKDTLENVQLWCAKCHDAEHCR